MIELSFIANLEGKPLEFGRRVVDTEEAFLILLAHGVRIASLRPGDYKIKSLKKNRYLNDIYKVLSDNPRLWSVRIK